METKPKRLRNEKGQFLSGENWDGNTEGRPEGSGQPFSLKVILERELQKCPEGQDKKTSAVLIIKRMLKEAIEKGDVQLIKLIWAYIEGLPRESLDLTSGGKPIPPFDYVKSRNNNGNRENPSDVQKDTNSAGRDGSEQDI